MDFIQAKQIETKNIKEAARVHFRLFEKRSFIDTPKFLEKYGLFVPEKKKFPLGYLKLWPQDFIVEEIMLDGMIQTVFPEKFLNVKKDFIPEDSITYATLVKCGLSTIEAAEELAKNLKTNSANIKYAGVKDKHAITSQLISIKNCDIDNLNRISASYYFIKNVFSGNKELFLGNLRGNQFTILIRTDSGFNEKGFSKRLRNLEKNGFTNFYYIQRFGVPRLIAPYCGLSILKGDYEGAVKNAICKTGERELFYFQNFRMEVEKSWGNWEEIESILDFFPLTFQNELRMVRYLVQNPTDFAGALNQIPRQVSIWIDSFGSLLFNKRLYFDIRENREPTPTYPLLSQEKKSWIFYKELLGQTGIFSLTHAYKNLQPFLYVIRKTGGVRKTKEKVEIINYKVLPMGVILNFNLPKGCYATSFLSHLFNLVSGIIPKKFSNLPIDTKGNIGKNSLEDILNMFSDVVNLPSWEHAWRI